ncbi:unannotated protein [freshwater metagenome]|uniref:Unannotated protein n=1 Tax=freshwater metagenome TaxID=449393 RepID=A0A6J6W607_9ZZZZ
MGDGIARNRYGIAHSIAWLRSENRDPGTLGHDGELVDGVGTLQVGGHQQRLMPLRLHPRR